MFYFENILFITLFTIIFIISVPSLLLLYIVIPQTDLKWLIFIYLYIFVQLFYVKTLKPRNRTVLRNKQNNAIPSLMIAIVLPDLDE